MKMKKHWQIWISTALIIALCLSVSLFTGCGRKENEVQEQNGLESGEVSGQENEVQEEESVDDMQTPSEDIEEQREIMVYYVDDQTAEVTGRIVEITNESDIWSALQESGILTEECELLSFAVNEDEKKIDLDFNGATGERIRSMGTTGETQIIGCIVNTYLEAYGCDGIRLTEEGQVLQTSHGADYDGYSGKITF